MLEQQFEKWTLHAPDDRPKLENDCWVVTCSNIKSGEPLFEFEVKTDDSKQACCSIPMEALAALRRAAEIYEIKNG